MLSLAQAQTEWFTFKNCTELEAEMWFLTFLARCFRDLLRDVKRNVMSITDWSQSLQCSAWCQSQFSRFRTTTATTVTRTQKTTQKTAVRQDRDLGDHHVFRDDFHHRDHHGKHHNIARGTFWKSQTTNFIWLHMIIIIYLASPWAA